MKFEAVDKGEAVLIHLGGRIGTGENELRLREKILQYLEKGKKRIILELGEVQIIDSESMSELVATYVTARRIGAVLMLANPTFKVKTLLEVTRLSGAIDTFDTTEEALKYSDRPDRHGRSESNPL